MDHATSTAEPRFAGVVRGVKAGELERFSELVTAFQDMAVGYAYALLGDIHLAEDAAQEAFLDAYRHLGELREPVAFPGWLRRIVFKHCDRRTRRKSLRELSFDELGYEPSGPPSPSDELERAEMRNRLLAAVTSLSEKQRSVLVLHYMSGQSLAEIGSFLDLPTGTIKKRLYDARTRLREILLDDLTDDLRGRRPSRDSRFTEGVVELLRAAQRGDAERVGSLLLRNPRLRDGRDLMGNTALIMAVNSGHSEVAALLREAGAKVGFHDAAAIGDAERLEKFLARDPRLVESFSEEGFTAVALAAHFGQLTTLRLLLDRGADPNVVSRHAIGVTALHAALFGKQVDAARLLIARGADVNARRGGRAWPRAGYAPLHYAAQYGFADLIPVLLERGADRNAGDGAGKTPLELAREFGRDEAIRVLETVEIETKERGLKR